MEQSRRREQMDINPAETLSHETVPGHESQNLVMLRDGRLRQLPQKSEHLLPILEVSAGKLADHERMYERLTLVEQRAEFRVFPVQVIDPDRGIDEHRMPLSARPDRAGDGEPARQDRTRQALRGGGRFPGISAPPVQHESPPSFP